MKAVTFDDFGGPEVLSLNDLPMPDRDEGEVLVKVAASTVNPTDLMMRNGAQAAMMTTLSPPFIAGMEFSGKIEDPGSSGLQKGQPVIGVINPRTPKGGAYAEYVSVSQNSVAPISQTLELTAAATLPMNALTAILALEFLDLQPGQSLLVTGGAGMLGGAAIQIAKARGLHVLANVAQADRELVKDLGAQHILPRNEGLERALNTLYPDGVDGLIDGALIGKDISHLVKDGGGVVSLRGTYKIDDPRLRVFNVSVLAGMEDREKMEYIARLANEGKIQPRVAEVFAAKDAKDAHTMTERSGFRGRAVLTF